MHTQTKKIPLFSCCHLLSSMGWYSKVYLYLVHSRTDSDVHTYTILVKNVASIGTICPYNLLNTSLIKASISLNKSSGSYQKSCLAASFWCHSAGAQEQGNMKQSLLLGLTQACVDTSIPLHISQVHFRPTPNRCWVSLHQKLAVYVAMVSEEQFRYQCSYSPLLA